MYLNKSLVFMSKQLVLLWCFMASTLCMAASTSDEPLTAQGLSDYIMHHLADSGAWHPLPFLHIGLGEKSGTLGVDMTITLHTVMLFLGSLFLILLFGVLYQKRSDKAPSGITHLLEVLVLFVRDEIARPNIVEDEVDRFTPLLCTFFFFILMLNLMGLIPLFATATGNVSITASLALITFVSMVGSGIYKHGVGGFFGHFVPHGVPVALVPLIFPIEFLGIFIKPFALCIRLFANMIAGHIVIFSILGMIILFGATALPALTLALGIYMLEVLVAFIQAFIFTMFSSMFIGTFLDEGH